MGKVESGSTRTIVLLPGQRGTMSGYEATVLRHYSGDMYEFRLPGGVACTDACDFIPFEDS